MEPHGGPGGVPGDPPICWWLIDGYLMVNLMIRHGDNYDFIVMSLLWLCYSLFYSILWLIIIIRLLAMVTVSKSQSLLDHGGITNKRG